MAEDKVGTVGGWVSVELPTVTVAVAVTVQVKLPLAVLVQVQLCGCWMSVHVTPPTAGTGRNTIAFCMICGTGAANGRMGTH